MKYGINTMMDLSTGHMPRANPDFGGLRVSKHEFGWVVFVKGGLSEKELAEICPEWLKRIMVVALSNDCIVINFDADADLVTEFPVFEW